MAIDQQEFLDIGLEVLNDEELKQLFSELKFTLQKKIVLDAFRQSAKPIISQAKQNLLTTAKGKSKDDYKTMQKGFKIEALKKRIGVKFGVQYYKARWIEWGTTDRSYSKGMKRASLRYNKQQGKAIKNEHRTGRIEGTHYFFNAVQAKKDEALQGISQAIRTEFDKTVNKYKQGKGKL